MVISPVHHVEASPARSQIQDPQEAQNLPVTSEVQPRPSGLETFFCFFMYPDVLADLQCMVGPSRTSTVSPFACSPLARLVGCITPAPD